MNDFDTYADLRSPARAHQRATANLKKYYSYKALKPSQRTQPHYITPCFFHADPNCQKCSWGTLPADPVKLTNVPVRALSKREFYEEAQCWPKPPRRHHAYPKRETKWGCMSNRWARRWENGKSITKELKHGNARLDDECAEDDVDHMINCGYCGGRCDPGWPGERFPWAEDNLFRDGYEDREGDGDAGGEVVPGDRGSESEDDEWDVVSCASEMSSWSEIEVDEWR